MPTTGRTMSAVALLSWWRGPDPTRALRRIPRESVEGTRGLAGAVLVGMNR